MFVVEQYKKEKTNSEILKMGKQINLNAIFIKKTLGRYKDTMQVLMIVIKKVVLGQKNPKSD